MLYADIILPLLPDQLFTYRIPEELTGKAQPGMRAVVQFGKRKFYTGIIKKIHQNPEKVTDYKSIHHLPDDFPLVNKFQFDFWDWLSDYYMCSSGEIYKAAVPSGLKSESESHEPSRSDVEKYISLAPSCKDPDNLHKILDKLTKAPKQQDLLLKILEDAEENFTDYQIPLKTLLQQSAQYTVSALVKKKILQVTEISTLTHNSHFPLTSPVILNSEQQGCYQKIKNIFNEKDVCLLHGVTSGGKTEIYIHLISETIQQGKQVLYLLPEIALTSQIIERLRAVFGVSVGIYHSRFSDKERIDVYKRVHENAPNPYKIILGVRSSVFLPFSNLGLVIVDEEHENTYKQFNPAPRYHARDASIMLAKIHKAKVILGTATPSIETWANCESGKYGLAMIKTRFGEIKLPRIIIANLKESQRKNKLKSVFTPILLEEIQRTLTKGKQVILFQNRRGYSFYLTCTVCGWIPRCIYCDVSLTYHRTTDNLVCHYCGFATKVPAHCDACGSTRITTKGFGTERIEDEIGLLLPDARPSRLDLDTSRSVRSYEKIIQDFSKGKTNVLVGTQLISKGLDFDKVGLVGIINADQMLNYPDFRAYERSFQLMMQVSGRAGRRDEQGNVIIQTSDPSNPIIRFVRDNNFNDFFKEQLLERQTFYYPPFVKIIKITLKHPNYSKVKKSAAILAENLRNIFGKRVLGPQDPLINRIQKYYLRNIILKIEKNASFVKARVHLRKILKEFQETESDSKLKIQVDVDPV